MGTLSPRQMLPGVEQFEFYFNTRGAGEEQAFIIFAYSQENPGLEYLESPWCLSRTWQRTQKMMLNTKGSYQSSLIFNDMYNLLCNFFIRPFKSCPLPQCQNEILCRPIVMKKKFICVFIFMQTHFHGKSFAQ